MGREFPGKQKTTISSKQADTQAAGPTGSRNAENYIGKLNPLATMNKNTSNKTHVYIFPGPTAVTDTSGTAEQRTKSQWTRNGDGLRLRLRFIFIDLNEPQGGSSYRDMQAKSNLHILQIVRVNIGQRTGQTIEFYRVSKHTNKVISTIQKL